MRVSRHLDEIPGQINMEPANIDKSKGNILKTDYMLVITIWTYLQDTQCSTM